MMWGRPSSPAPAPQGGPPAATGHRPPLPGASSVESAGRMAEATPGEAMGCAALSSSRALLPRVSLCDGAPCG